MCKPPTIPGLKIGGYSRSSATFSDCEQFRYTLQRRWDVNGDDVAFIGLNPSTADAEKDDPTVRRCIAFAKRWGYGGMFMLNIHAFRSTDPAALYERTRDGLEITGPENDDYLFEVCDRVHRIICCWGTHGSLGMRGDVVARLLKHRPLHCLGRTQNGQPKHPLYLRADTRPEVFS